MKKLYEVTCIYRDFVAMIKIHCTLPPDIGNISSHECLYGSVSNYNLLQVFGNACFVHLLPRECTKLECSAHLCCLLEYGIKHKGYRCWDLVSSCLRLSRHLPLRSTRYSLIFISLNCLFVLPSLLILQWTYFQKIEHF